MMWIIIAIVPYGLLVYETGMNLIWATLATQSFTTPFLIPVLLSITWAKATGQGVVAGNIISYTDSRQCI